MFFMRNKIIYIFSWSVLLLVATFPDLFKTTGEAITADRDFLLPLLLAVLLAGIDVVYIYRTELGKGRQTDLFWTYVWTLVFIAALIVSLFYTNTVCTVVGFCTAWASLTGMKFAVTEKCEEKVNQIRTIPEE